MASPLLCVSRLFLPTTITGEVPAALLHVSHTPLRSALFETAWNSYALEASLNAVDLFEKTWRERASRA